MYKLSSDLAMTEYRENKKKQHKVNQVGDKYKNLPQLCLDEKILFLHIG